MKKLLVLLMVATIISCSVKEQPAETKEERESRENIQRLNREADSLDRLADSLELVQSRLEKFYDNAIKLERAGYSADEAIKKMKDIDSSGYALYMISQQNKKK